LSDGADRRAVAAGAACRSVHQTAAVTRIRAAGRCIRAADVASTAARGSAANAACTARTGRGRGAGSDDIPVDELTRRSTRRAGNPGVGPTFTATAYE